MIEYLHRPNNGDGKTGLDDFLAEHTVDELWTLVRPDPPEMESRLNRKSRLNRLQSRGPQSHPQC
jgi:hypothetical protein